MSGRQRQDPAGRGRSHTRRRRGELGLSRHTVRRRSQRADTVCGNLEGGSRFGRQTGGRAGPLDGAA